MHACSLLVARTSCPSPSHITPFAFAAGHYLVAPQLLLQPGEDPFSLLKQEKKDRQKKQNKQQLANVKQAIKTGGAAAVPATLRLAATLPDKGKGKPTKRRELRDEVRRLLGFGGSRAKDDCDYSSASVGECNSGLLQYTVSRAAGWS
jgi:hypothetical protein